MGHSILTPKQAALMINRSVDFCYKHWKKWGGVVKSTGGRKSTYLIEESKLKKYWGMEENADVSSFVSNLTEAQKRELVFALLPEIRENLFNLMSEPMELQKETNIEKEEKIKNKRRNPSSAFSEELMTEFLLEIIRILKESEIFEPSSAL